MKLLNWQDFISAERNKEYFRLITEKYEEDSLLNEVFPPKDQIFNAFEITPFDETKVVILGMDPYHNPGQAHGLSFSVKENTPIPPSLRNIFKEMKSDLGVEPPKSGDLSYLAKQGVLLLNSSLTVLKNKPGSHMKLWEPFTDNAISYLDSNKNNIVYILWGAFARDKKKLINNPTSCIIESAHPSPLSAKKFFGTKPFSKANEFLIQNEKCPINWVG